MSLILAAILAAAPTRPAAPVATRADPQEVACVYDQLGASGRSTVAQWLDAEETGAADAEAKARPTLDSAVAACAARFRWDPARKGRGGLYALYRIELESRRAALPAAAVSPDTLEAAFLGLSDDDRARFTDEGAARLGQDDAWKQRARTRLLSAGVPEAQLGLAIDYLLAYAQFRTAAAAWDRPIAPTGR